MRILHELTPTIKYLFTFYDKITLQQIYYAAKWPREYSKSTRQDLGVKKLEQL